MEEAQLTAITDRFHAAALGADSWPEALAAFAALTGSRAGQLIGLGSDKSVPFK